MVDSLLGVLITMLFGIPLALYMMGLLSAELAAGSAIAIIALFIWLVIYQLDINYLPSVVQRIVDITLRFVRKIPSVQNVNQFKDYNYNIFKDLKKSELLVSVMSGIIAYLMVMLASWFLLLSLENTVNFLEYFLLFPLISIMVVFGFTPGGIGVHEASWFGVLLYLGLPSEAAAEFVVVRRLLYEVTVVVICGIVNVIYHSLMRISNTPQS